MQAMLTSMDIEQVPSHGQLQGMLVDLCALSDGKCYTYRSVLMTL